MNKSVDVCIEIIFISFALRRQNSLTHCSFVVKTLNFLVYINVLYEIQKTMRRREEKKTEDMDSGLGPSMGGLSLSPSGTSSDHPKIKGYQFRGKLGQGGFATVWHFYDPADGRDVAVKRFCIAGAMNTRADGVSFQKIFLCQYLL